MTFGAPGFLKASVAEIAIAAHVRQLGFSDGAHACIGLHTARMEARIGLKAEAIRGQYARCSLTSRRSLVTRRSDHVVESFPIVPASSRPLWFFGVIALLLLVVLVFLVYAAYSTQATRIEVSTTSLRIRGDVWGRRIPLDALRVDEAAIVDLGQRTDLVPRWRTLGTGLPGYASGWFRLNNGEKALVVLTTRREVVYLPTRLGYSLLVSVEAPGELIDRIRAQLVGGIEG